MGAGRVPRGRRGRLLAGKDVGDDLCNTGSNPIKACKRHIAGGEIYEYYFYSPSKRISTYRFVSPFHAAEAGDVDPATVDVQKGGGPVANPPRCIASMTLSLARVMRIAAKAGFLPGERVPRVPQQPDHGAGWRRGDLRGVLAGRDALWLVLLGPSRPRGLDRRQ